MRYDSIDILFVLFWPFPLDLVKKWMLHFSISFEGKQFIITQFMKLKVSGEEL